MSQTNCFLPLPVPHSQQYFCEQWFRLQLQMQFIITALNKQAQTKTNHSDWSRAAVFRRAWKSRSIKLHVLGFSCVSMWTDLLPCCGFNLEYLHSLSGVFAHATLLPSVHLELVKKLLLLHHEVIYEVIAKCVNKKCFFHQVTYLLCCGTSDEMIDMTLIL